ncbi:MAG TPA: DUF47 family protein [Candidatus Omnitrophota bacterium]|nr:DUF47 family protein [Candidatus Omnitrophota bacterium]HPT06937.1 DUF47 family protein [Candidatus Omnitrophota bacterium]
MILKFFPTKFNFFDLFEVQVGCAVEAAKSFSQIVTSGVVDEAAVTKIKDIEHHGDEAAHTIIDQLNKTFITPFDREDIHRLAKEIDDVIDMINTIVSRLSVYKLSGKNKNLIEFAAVIEKSVFGVACAVRGMRDKKLLLSVTEACVEVNRLENVGDAMRDQVLAALFEEEKNPITVIKWKEIYQDAETVLDICEDVVHVVSAILVKQA